MKHRRYLLALLLAGSAYAQSEGTDFKSLMMEALSSPSGSSKADVYGPVADQIRSQINRPDARVVAYVTTVKALPQSGCKRLKLKMDTPGTLFMAKDGVSAPLEFGVEMNLCPNGQPPG